MPMTVGVVLNRRSVEWRGRRGRGGRGGGILSEDEGSSGIGRSAMVVDSHHCDVGFPRVLQRVSRRNKNAPGFVSKLILNQ